MGSDRTFGQLVADYLVSAVEADGTFVRITGPDIQRVDHVGETVQAFRAPRRSNARFVALACRSERRSPGISAAQASIHR